MDCLADTNIVLRWVVRTDPLHGTVRAAVIALRDRGDRVVVCPQNLVEMHAVATRPVAANGLGISSGDARALATAVEHTFIMLPDTPDVHANWARLADSYGVIGRQAFDLRIVALMVTYGITHLLTLDPTHFTRYSEISVLTPAQAAETGAT